MWGRRVASRGIPGGLLSKSGITGGVLSKSGITGGVLSKSGITGRCPRTIYRGRGIAGGVLSKSGITGGCPRTIYRGGGIPDGLLSRSEHPWQVPSYYLKKAGCSLAIRDMFLCAMCNPNECEAYCLRLVSLEASSTTARRK